MTTINTRAPKQKPLELGDFFEDINGNIFFVFNDNKFSEVRVLCVNKAETYSSFNSIHEVNETFNSPSRVFSELELY